ncbi:MAG: filamentous hemagglutinin N-terminal domain-containing protein [Spirirestis rafaelensis WJT71-NPBG6]|jgi:filamentous hemagglutinin family protein|nr:filamentous hemagglutinin N-terminal domain-containing protein [Spirirestis rafaelensis WJT71-NPBG6]
MINRWGWLLAIAMSTTGYAYALCEYSWANSAIAQISADTTLPTNSIVTPQAQILNITGGTRAGSNLFHSFQEFSVPTGGTAFFNNALDISNIISRVTGNSISNIDGLIRANGSANVFLLNPNGIIFGNNASLNVGGSFVGSTANAIQFGTAGIFSATTPNAPTPLLTINPSALLFLQPSPAAITSRSTAPAGMNLAGVEVTGLRVPDGRSLLLVGGDVNLDGGSLRAYNGRIELAGLAAPGNIGLNFAGNILSLGVLNDVQRANVSLTNSAELNVRGSDAGAIAINAQNLSLARASKVRAGIDTGNGTTESKAGDVDINATGTTTLTDDSFIANVPQPSSVGKGGNINITTGWLALINGSGLNTTNFGQGDGGNINLNVRDALTLSGVGQTGISAILSTVQPQAVGKGGNINIIAGSVSLADGSQLTASTYGQGDAGNISIQARDFVSLAGSNSTIFNNIESGGVGNGGNINITAPSLTLQDGAQLQAGLRGTDIQNNLPGGRGNGGNINIDVSGAVTLAVPNNNSATAIFTDLENGAQGNGGNINIKSGSLSLGEGTFINASTAGNGNAGNIFVQARDAISLKDSSSIFSTVNAGAVGNGGNITIDAASVSLTNGSEFNSRTFGQGNAGNITINARDTVSFDGQEKNGGIFSRAITAVIGDAVGKAGDIQIATSSLKLTNGAFLSSGTLGKGDGGNITIDARDTVTFDSGSSASSIVGSAGIGKGGNIRVTTGSLSVTNGAALSTSVSGQGEAGNITVEARDKVSLDGAGDDSLTGIFSSLITGGIGKGGDIRVTTGSLSVTNGALLTADTNGRGNGGNITINARDTVTFDGVGNIQLPGSRASSTVGSNAVGNGGNIEVTARALSLTNGGQLTASGFGQGNAGNITIDSRDTVDIDGISRSEVESGVSTFSVNGGDGGNISVTTGMFSSINGGRLSSLSSRNAGNITIDARDAVNFEGVNNSSRSGGAFTSLLQGNPGKAGDIQITTRSFTLSNGAQLLSTTSGQGNGGDITINARDSVKFDGVGSNQSFSGAFSNVESGGVGNAGNIKVTTGSLSLSNTAKIAAATFGTGNAGNININARDAISLNGINNNQFSTGIFSTVESSGVGKGGDIELTSGSLSLANQAQINSGTFGQGDAGNISLNVDNAISLNNSLIRGAVFGGGVGKAGNIDILTRSLDLTNGAEIQSVLLRSPNQQLAGARGSGGNIRINASDSLTLSGVSERGFSSAIFTTSDRGTSGPAGNIIITTDKFAVRDGGIVSAVTSNSDNGGNITLNARTFEALNGGQVTTSTRSSGNAGTIKLNLRDRLTVAGSDPNYTQRIAQVEQRLRQPGETDQLGDVVINEGAASGIFATTAVGSTGNGGSIFIDPRQVTIRDGGRISVNSDGTGDAGNITLKAGILTLDNQASISGQTAGSQGGNININLQDVLVLRRGSQISTTAGTAFAGGDGGNITINAPFIVALPQDNSDITANAFTGKGGNINISAQGVFGIEARSQPTPQSDITASSQFGLSGDVIITNPYIDPTQGLLKLPVGLVNTPGLIASSCAAFDKDDSSFIVTGRSGLPSSPDDFLSGDVVWSDTRAIPKARFANATRAQQHPAKAPIASSPSKLKAVEILPATGWVFNDKGEVTLISSAPNASNSGFAPPNCSQR